MSFALSGDLRERVLAAIEAGMSGRQAAVRFAVSPASVSRWRARVRETGSCAPGALGGDRRSHQIEQHGEVILALVRETPDQTLKELRSRLAEKGLPIGYGGLWRFLDRHQIAFKKNRARQRARAS